MSMIRKLAAVIAVLVLTVTYAGPGYARNTTTSLDAKELECLALNIYHEAKGESTAGKIAVGMVTINRTTDSKFPSTICGVVQQKKYFTKTIWINSYYVQVPRKNITVKMEIPPTMVYKTYTVCQFGWFCANKRSPNKHSKQWDESVKIAKDLMTSKQHLVSHGLYSEALYFHSTKERPKWRHKKTLVGKIGQHIFYR